MADIGGKVRFIKIFSFKTTTGIIINPSITLQTNKICLNLQKAKHLSLHRTGGGIVCGKSKLVFSVCRTLKDLMLFPCHENVKMQMSAYTCSNLKQEMASCYTYIYRYLLFYSLEVN